MFQQSKEVSVLWPTPSVAPGLIFLEKLKKNTSGKVEAQLLKMSKLASGLKRGFLSRVFL